jgi:hypothetical protein
MNTLESLASNLDFLGAGVLLKFGIALLVLMVILIVVAVVVPRLKGEYRFAIGGAGGLVGVLGGVMLWRASLSRKQHRDYRNLVNVPVSPTHDTWTMVSSLYGNVTTLAEPDVETGFMLVRPEHLPAPRLRGKDDVDVGVGTGIFSVLSKMHQSLPAVADMPSQCLQVQLDHNHEIERADVINHNGNVAGKSVSSVFGPGAVPPNTVMVVPVHTVTPTGNHASSVTLTNFGGVVDAFVFEPHTHETYSSYAVKTLLHHLGHTNVMTLFGWQVFNDDSAVSKNCVANSIWWIIHVLLNRNNFTQPVDVVKLRDALVFTVLNHDAASRIYQYAFSIAAKATHY